MTKQTTKARNMAKLSRPEGQQLPCLPEAPETSMPSSTSHYAQWLGAMKANQLRVIEAENRNWQGALASLAESLGQKRWVLGTGSLAIEARTCIERLNGVSAEAFDRAIETQKDRLFDSSDVSLSFASFGIAETGTLVLESSEFEPRSLSLVPEQNVIVIDQHKLVPNLSVYMDIAKLHPGLARSNTILVSSPSKTADIQQKLAYGAHGPRSVFVIVY